MIGITTPMTFATAYSGVGGADLGFQRAGWNGPLWQCELNTHRSHVLNRRFGPAIFSNIATVKNTGGLSVDALYAEFPDWRLDRWWPDVWRLAHSSVRQWLICEMSPTVRFDSILRDICMDGWAFRVVFVECILIDGDTSGDSVGPVVDSRHRVFVIASPDATLVDEMGLSGCYIKAIFGLTITEPPDTIGWAERTRGLPLHWTCACETPEQCACDPEERRLAAQDASCPVLCEWLAKLVDGSWGEKPKRIMTKATGGECNV